MEMPNTPVKYEVLSKQYLRSILDVSGKKWRVLGLAPVHHCRIHWVGVVLFIILFSSQNVTVYKLMETLVVMERI